MLLGLQGLTWAKSCVHIQLLEMHWYLLHCTALFQPGGAPTIQHRRRYMFFLGGP